jgi:hypothetical protein
MKEIAQSGKLGSEQRRMPPEERVLNVIAILRKSGANSNSKEELLFADYVLQGAIP